MATARTRTCAVSSLLIAVGCAATPSLADGPGELVCKLDEPRVKESSGLALGAGGLFWTHNDSGGSPTLFGFDDSCTLKREVALEGAEARDWEELAAWDQDGARWLLVGDTGDNKRTRDHLTLYVLSEPAAGAQSVPVARTLDFRFPDGPHDCEAIAVEPDTDTILLITKDRGEGTRIYRLPLAPSGGPDPVATELARLELGPEGDMSARRVIAMDLSPDGTRLALLTYTSAWVYARDPSQPWAQTFATTPTAVGIPALEQGEALAWSADGTALYLTSEGVPMPLVRIEP